MNDNPREETLWMLQYRLLSPTGKAEVLTRLQFFYAQDRAEAEQVCEALLVGKERIPAYSQLQCCEHGAMVARKFLPGKRDRLDEGSKPLERV